MKNSIHFEDFNSSEESIYFWRFILLLAGLGTGAAAGAVLQGILALQACVHRGICGRELCSLRSLWAKYGNKGVFYIFFRKITIARKKIQTRSIDNIDIFVYNLTIYVQKYICFLQEIIPSKLEF